MRFNNRSTRASLALRLCLTLAAASLLQACAHSPGNSLPSASAIVPNPPAYLKREKVAAPSADESWPIVAKRYERGLARANTKIEAAERDWRAMKATLGRE